MKRVDPKILIAAVAMVSVLTGCQTTDNSRNSTLTQIGISTAVGGVVGVLTNSAVGSAVASTIAGLASAVIVNYESKRVRSTPEERRIYGVTTPISNPQVKIQKGTNSPKWVKAGQKVGIWTTYWLNLPAGETTAFATESWVIKVKDKDVPLVTLGPTHGERESGKRQATLDFVVPEGVSPGTYVIEHKIQSGSSSATSTSEFTVLASS